MSKKGFFLVSFFLVSCLCAEFYCLKLRPQKTKELKEFVRAVGIFAPAFYSNSFFLRHKDLKNSNILTPFHPGLRESEIGTFVQNYKKHTQ